MENTVLTLNTNAQWETASTHHFLYDGWNLVSEFRSQHSGVSTNHFAWGLDLSGTPQGAGGIGGLLFMLNAESQLLTPAYDANGNITEYISTNGTIAARYEYDPFGNTIAQTGPQADNLPFRFSTKYTDNETGLIYYGYRHFSPTLGRWPNRDPIGEVGGLNLYAIVDNEHLTSLDYLGLAKLTLSYDFSDNVSWWERILLPSNTEWINTMAGVQADIKNKVKPYHKDGKDPCNCIKKITLTDHSGVPGLISLGDGIVHSALIEQIKDYHSGQVDLANQRIMRRETEFLTLVGSYLCANATVDFVQCSSGSGPRGEILKDYLENILPSWNIHHPISRSREMGVGKADVRQEKHQAKREMT